MANSVPTLTGLDTPVVFLENTVNGAAQIIDANVTFADADGNFNGGALTVSNLLAEDTVAIRNQGTAAGEIGVSGSDVTFGGVIIGGFAGGASSTLTVTFNAVATAAAIEALIENLTYANSSDAPTASRSLELKVTDAAGFAAIAPLAFAAQTGAANPFDGAGFDVGDETLASFADLDGDGDLDLVVGEYDGNLNYFENTGSAIAPAFTERTGAANPFDGVDVGFNSGLSFADLDGDGDLDAIEGDGSGGQIYFENTGSATAPAFAAAVLNPFGLANVGFISAPSFADLDGDGDLDAVVGEFEGNLTYFENTGSAVAPAFAAAVVNPFGLANVGLLSVPSFADLDGDGDLDGVVGEFGGNLIYFENTGSPKVPAFIQRTGGANPFNTVDVVLYSTPSFADLDGDGDLDTVVGAFDGTLNYFRNTTPPAIAPDFAEQTGAANPFNGVGGGADSAPSFADLDGDGDLDAIVGELFGTLRYFENTGSAIAPAFTERTGAANPFDGVDVGYRSTPSFADLDGDGDLDAVIGEIGGTLRYFENTGSATAPAFTAQTGAANPFDGIDVGNEGAPSFVDLDGDGDLDAVVGDSNGNLNYFENTGSATAPDFVQRTGAANPFDGVNVVLASTPSFADFDGDGDLDAVVGENDGTLNYFENTGSAKVAAFTERTGAANPFAGVDVGGYSKPSFADLDGDGDLDVVVGEGDGNLNYFRNTGAGFVLMVDVTAESEAPLLANPIPDQASLENAFWTFQVPANSFAPVGGGGPLAYTATLGNGDPLPDWLAFDASTQTFTGTPPRNFVGNVELKVTSTDAGEDTSDLFFLNVGPSSSVPVNLTPNPDTYNAGNTGEMINALAGNDTVTGGLGNDVINGNDGNDTIGGGGANVLHGDGGNDFVASIGNLNEGWGDDGADLLFFVGDQNQLFGGAGNDWHGVSGTNNALAANGGDDWLGASGNFNTLNGQDGNDFLVAVGIGNVLHGETGNDWLGVSGHLSQLFGGAGNDWLGATGSGNVLDGGAGNDTLVAATAAHQGDVFNYRPGYAQDELIGFARHGGGGTDVVSIQGFGVTTFGQLQGLMTQSGADTVITFNTADILTIRNVLPGQWQATDFQLA